MKRYFAVAMVACLMGAVGGAATAVGVLAYSHRGGSTYFTDCSASSAHNEDVGWAYEYGIVKGMNGLYHPTNPVTREQMTSYLMRQSTADIMSTIILMDLTYFSGVTYGYTAFMNGTISYDQYIMFSDYADWVQAMMTYETGQMGSSGVKGMPQVVPMAAEVLQARLAVTASEQGRTDDAATE
jgi:S-layer homology domain